MAKILVIAAVDSSGGAGVAADIRAAYDIGVEVSLAVTATTAQGTDFSAGCSVNLQEQLDATSGFDAVKVGMIGSLENVIIIGDFLRKVNVPIIIDPVIATSSGHRLMEGDVFEYLKNEILGDARACDCDTGQNVSRETNTCKECGMQKNSQILLTPNADEAVYFEDILCDKLIKSYKSDGENIIDKLINDGQVSYISNKKYPVEMRGTGCMLSTAIACYVAKGVGIVGATQMACQYLSGKFASKS